MWHRNLKLIKVRNIIFIQSLGGGTGSGVGSYILQNLKRDFPFLKFCNFLVLPLISGEVTLQYYNTILSLSVIYQFSDVIFLIQNDQAQKICQSVFQTKKKISFGEINHVIALKILGALLNFCCFGKSYNSKIWVDNFQEKKEVKVYKLFLNY